MFKGVNWTCEGLKHFANFKWKHDNIKCELNLWGIETAQVQVIHYIVQGCELNLWGIETNTQGRG